jgi:hypothetical protein
VDRTARRSVRHWIEPLDFMVENGAGMLGQWFDQVDTVVRSAYRPSNASRTSLGGCCVGGPAACD